MVNSATDVQEGTILEVVLNTQPLGKFNQVAGFMKIHFVDFRVIVKSNNHSL